MDNEYGKEFLGKGFKFPIGPDSVTGKMGISSYEQSIIEAIHIILMTRKGERVMQPEFGCDIYDFAFGTLDYGSLSKMSSSVRNALILWEPRIENVEVNVTAGDSSDGMAMIDISYVVRTTNNPYNLVFPFYLNEGLDIGDAAEDRTALSMNSKRPIESVRALEAKEVLDSISDYVSSNLKADRLSEVLFSGKKDEKDKAEDEGGTGLKQADKNKIFDIPKKGALPYRKEAFSDLMKSVYKARKANQTVNNDKNIADNKKDNEE